MKNSLLVLWLVVAAVDLKPTSDQRGQMDITGSASTNIQMNEVFGSE